MTAGNSTEIDQFLVILTDQVFVVNFGVIFHSFMLLTAHVRTGKWTLDLEFVLIGIPNSFYAELKT